MKEVGANPYECWYPDCLSIGHRRLRHGIQLNRCVACDTAFYCDRVCQRAHWRNHRGQCRELQRRYTHRRAVPCVFGNLVGQQHLCHSRSGCGSWVSQATGGVCMRCRPCRHCVDSPVMYRHINMVTGKKRVLRGHSGHCEMACPFM